MATYEVSAPAVHVFPTSGDAYDMSQCDDRIANGDVLWVPDETSAGPRGAVAVLMHAWPIAVNAGYVTDVTGSFHSPIEGATPDDVAASMNDTRGESPAFDWSPSLVLAAALVSGDESPEVRRALLAGRDYRF